MTLQNAVPRTHARYLPGAQYTHDGIWRQTITRLAHARPTSSDAVRTFRSIYFKDSDMNTLKITFAFAALAMTASVYAATPADSVTGNHDAQATNQWAPVAMMPMARTRTEVRQELEQARQSGEIDALRKLYSGH
ncbi:DUF4148 domain-containing protein [Burkholderia sp. S-53]|uniref:DUF4148 domain-containing protein n=1 Tax=Burkholderia sp. S-53 TaxID=2906514 RepID=UPI0021CFB378|nr:DUF4148 domain-containing protein [Burkholderia sp. S-53]UXU85677.1 DUF4148 domain-containing protein [Burkholderia sp. S-53]